MWAVLFDFRKGEGEGITFAEGDELALVLFRENGEGRVGKLISSVGKVKRVIFEDSSTLSLTMSSFCVSAEDRGTSFPQNMIKIPEMYRKTSMIFRRYTVETGVKK